MAKNRPGTLGIIELVAAADDTPLRQTLAQDERLVRDSAAKMQTSLSQTTVGTTAAIGGMSATAVSGTQAFGLLGAQMSAVGGVAGQAIGPLTAFGGALAGIGKAAFGPLGLLLLVTGALTLMIGKLIESKRAAKEAREEFDQFVNSIAEGQRKLEQTTAGLGFRAERLRAELAGDPIAVRRIAGARRRAELQAEISRSRQEELELRQQLLATPGIVAGGPAVQAFQDRRDAMRRHRAEIRDIIVLEKRKELQEIAKLEADARQKELDAEKKLAEDSAAARQKAFEKFAATPFGRVGVAIRDIVQETLQQRQLEAAVQRLDAILPAILDPFIRKIRAKLGLSSLEEAAAEQPAAARLPRIFGVRATAFPDLAALSGAGGQATSELVQLARVRTKRATNMDKTLVRIDQKRTGLN